MVGVVMIVDMICWQYTMVSFMFHALSIPWTSLVWFVGLTSFGWLVVPSGLFCSSTSLLVSFLSSLALPIGSWAPYCNEAKLLAHFGQTPSISIPDWLISLEWRTWLAPHMPWWRCADLAVNVKSEQCTRLVIGFSLWSNILPSGCLSFVDHMLSS